MSRSLAHLQMPYPPHDEPTAQTASPDVQTEPTAQTASPDVQTEPTAQAALRSDWYTDTLRAIVSRALDSDKPDIKGALAALQLLAEAQDTPAAQDDDIAHILRDARRRVVHGRQN